MDKHLNPEQQSAIEHGSGPLLIIAGAGTGKTTVITERVKHLIENKLAQPSEILCLTFTEKAATEMETRIDQALPLGYSQLWVTTFHSFCDRILKDEALNIGLDPSFKLLSSPDSVVLLEKNIFTLPLSYYRPLGNPQKFLMGLLSHISRLKDEDITPGEYLTWSEKVTDPEGKARYQELANMYLAYEDLKIKTSLMDYSDLISNTISLFRLRPNILKLYQTKFKYILVDEFQDTNYAQNILVTQLAGQNQNLTVVADDDQAIYRWRGAAVSNILGFKKSYPTAKIIVLTENYRSTQTILDSAYQLIQHNNPDRLEFKEGINKKLVSHRGELGERVEIIHALTSDQEADLVAQKIQQLLDATNYPLTPSDFAILVRANNHAQPFIKSLTNLGIPVRFQGPTKLFQQPEIKDLVSYLEVLTDYSNNTAMYRVLSQPYFHISGRDLIAITTLSKSANCTIFESCELLLALLPAPVGVTIPLLSETGVISLTKIITQLHHDLSSVSSQSTGKILYNFLSQTGIMSAILSYQEPFGPGVAENVIQLFDKIKSYETTHPEALCPEVITWLHLSGEMDSSSSSLESDLTEDAVNIYTVHSSKGLEFKVVFVVNLVAQRFPSTSRKEQIPIPEELIKEDLSQGDYHLQEERRLFFVAVTRAKDQLFLTAADYYGDAKRQKKLSPFISECLGELPASHESVISRSTSLDLPPINNPNNKSRIPNFTVNYLSYSQIQTFEVCPLHYKAKYILGIPTAPSAASSFGNTVHLTLKEFYTQLKRQTREASVTSLQTQIQNIYKSVWSPVGYDNRAHADLYFQKGLTYLSNYVASQHFSYRLPHAIEYPFNLPLVSDISSDHLKIGGKMDRIDILPDGAVEIIDYKTSAEMLDQKSADSSLQLSFYAIAATSLIDFPFPVTPDKLKLTLHYFETNEQVSTTRSQLQLDSAKQEIFSYREQILNSNFKCSGSPLCNKCDFELLCNSTS